MIKRLCRENHFTIVDLAARMGVSMPTSPALSGERFSLLEDQQ